MHDAIVYHSAYNCDRIVHVVDDSIKTCEELGLTFKFDNYLTSFSLDLVDVFNAIERRQPDLLIMNMEVDGQSTLPLLRRIKTERFRTAVFMVSNEPDVERAVEAMKAGAQDVFVRPFNKETMLIAAREIFRKTLVISNNATGGTTIKIGGFKNLTPREREVLEMISNGSTSKQAGVELDISYRTVEVHRKKIMLKLGARNAADLMRIVLTS